MGSVVQELVDLIQLEQLEVDLFRGLPRDTGQGSIFGGLVAGQALMAASRTVDADRPVHSLHAYFLRPGDVSMPVIYEVDRIRDGRGFTTRRVKAVQKGKAIFSLAASFKLQEEGFEHQSDMPDVPGPETLRTDREVRAEFAPRLPEQYREAFLQERPVDYRTIKPINSYDIEPQSAQRIGWFRLMDQVDVDEATNRALLTFCSDMGLMGTAMLPHGIHFFQSDIQAASIDHAMWFHRPFRIDEWLLYVTESPAAAGATGINFGRIYRKDGVLVATTAQEGLMRKSG